MAKKVTKKAREEMKQALEKAREQQLKDKEYLQSLSKKFPEGVLKKGEDTGMHVLDIDLKQEALNLMTTIATGFADRLQANDDKRQKGTDKTKAKAEKNFQKFITIAKRENIDIGTLKKSALEPSFHKHGLNLKESTLYNYQCRYLEEKKLLS